MKRLSVQPSVAGWLSGAAVVLAAAALAVAAVALASDSSSEAKTGALPSKSSAVNVSSLRSPDGRFTVAATDTGIVLSGPVGTVKLDLGGVSIDAPIVALRGAARVDLVGPLLRLNSTSGCLRAARVGDPVPLPGGGAGGVAHIASGSATVCVGG